MIPGVELILLDLENPFLQSRDRKNRRKTQNIEINISNFFKTNLKFWNKNIVFFLINICNLCTPSYDMARLMRIPVPKAMGVATTQAPLYFC